MWAFKVVIIFVTQDFLSKIVFLCEENLRNMTTLQTVSKRPRKQRTVNNAYVDIDSVTCEPGVDYSNWITLCKQKLQVKSTCDRFQFSAFSQISSQFMYILKLKKLKKKGTRDCIIGY